MIYNFDLQLFSEKTEQPTAKKKSDARKKGQVAQSKDLNGAITLIAVFLVIGFLSRFYFERLFGFFHYTMSISLESDSLFATHDFGLFWREMIFTILLLSLPTLLVAMILGALVSYMQVGPLFSLETIQPKLEKINPLKGAKNIFSTRSLVELAKSLSKAVLVILISVTYINKHLLALIATVEMEIVEIVTLMWSLIFGIIIRCSLLLFVIALFDYAYKKWKNNKDLMMSKQEVKDEYKQSEGDPKLKAKIREKQRTFAMQRMMQDVPKADVIVTNPTHFAVALQYDTKKSLAPLVVAKGQDLIAQNIKRVAGEHDVPIVENKPLARALYGSVEIGQMIPAELYEAVAEVLAYVYNLKNEA